MTSKSGLTIIEVLISLAVIGLVFAALAAVQLSSLRVTAASRADSDLLQAGVRGFERVRTAVLADFSSFNRVCSGESGTLPTGWSCEGDLADPDLAYRIRGAGGTDGTGIEGLVRVTFEATRAGRALDFSQYISCLDAVQTPALSDTSLCELSPGS